MIKAGNSVSDAEYNVSDVPDYQKNQFIKQFDEELRKVGVRILNLIFGNSDISGKFWEQQLTKQIRYDFDYTLELLGGINDLPKGYFLNACIYHFNIELEEKSYTNIGNTIVPFKLEDLISIDNRG